MKRILVLLASLALVAGALSSVPATAAEAPEMPAIVQIDDPVGDANAVNDQDVTGTPLSGQGDYNQADVGTATDLMKVWFTNTPTHVSLHFQTEGDPTNLAYDSYFRFASNPGTGPVATNEARGCLFWMASINGAAGGYTGETQGVLEDECNVGEGVAGPLTTAPGPETTFISTMTFPRSSSPLLADGGKVLSPYGISRIVYVGPLPEAGTAAYVTMDTTKRGSEYALVSGAPTKPTKPPKPAKPAKPTTPVKKGCDKGKGKKKGCAKTPKPATCPSFTPGDAGKDKPTVVLTDEATEAKPVEQKINLDASLADVRLVSQIPAAGPLAVTYDYFNIQVDSASPEMGVYALFEFPTRRDYDMNMLHPDGSYAARARSFNPVVGTPGSIFSTPGHAGEGTDKSEKIVGVKTSDCGGWTIAAENHLGEGGEMVIKLWLGPAVNDPQAPGEEPAG